MSICIKYGCDYQLDLDGQVTCTLCGAMDDDKHVISYEKFNNITQPKTDTISITPIDSTPPPVISLKSFENQVDFE
jgi:hypothetical protein